MEMINCIKRIFILPLCLAACISFSPLNCVFHSEKKISFLIGLVNDYGGKQYIPSHPKEKYFITDFYYSQKKTLDKFKQGIEDAGLNIQDFEFIESKGESPITKVYSTRYWELFNSYYDFKKGRRFIIYDEILDKDFFAYTGILKKSKFNNSAEKIEFLKGCYIRNGRKISNRAYELAFANSVSKFKLAEKFCKNLKFDVIDTKVNNTTTPASYIVRFVPNKRFIELLENL